MEPAYKYRARLRSIYDGDTVRLDIDLGFGVWVRNQSIRLHGIDTPEIRGDERPEGLKVLAHVRELFALVGDKTFVIETFKDSKGKYGRWLAVIWLPRDNGQWLNLNTYLVENGMATVYKGR